MRVILAGRPALPRLFPKKNPYAGGYRVWPVRPPIDARCTLDSRASAAAGSTRLWASACAGSAVPLLCTPHPLPRVLRQAEVDGFVTTLRTARDRAMVAAILCGASRRSEVLKLRLDDVRVGEKRLFIAECKVGHQGLVPASAKFFAMLGEISTTSVLTPLSATGWSSCSKGPRRGLPLSAAELDEIMRGTCRRSGVAVTCHHPRCSAGTGRAIPTQ